MKINKLYKILILIYILTIIFSFNVYGYTYDAYDIGDLKDTVYEQLSLLNANFEIRYSGLYEDIENTLKNTIENDTYLDSIISTVNWSVSESSNVYNIKMNVNYILTSSEKLEADEMINNILTEIIKPNMNDHEKVKAVHDYIVLNGEYDTSLQLYSDYEFLTKGKSVCNGYALLTYNMLNKLNIPVRLVSGTGNEEPHVWNIVKIDKYWFHLDTTWNDPVPDKKDSVSYNYYLLTEEEISKDHTINKNQYLPKSNKKYYTFLKELSLIEKNGYVYDRILMETELDIYNVENTATSAEGLSTILKNKIKYHPVKVSVRFNKSISQDSVNTAMSDLFRYSFISEIRHEPFYLDDTGNFYVLNLYIKYKKTPDSIITDLSKEVYNTTSKVDFNVYAVYGSEKENINKDVLIYPYDNYFLNISDNTLSFNDAGFENLTLEYGGKRTKVNISAIDSNGFKYITDEKPSSDVNVKVFNQYIDFSKIKQWPLIEDGRTLVPIRAIFEVLNCNVNWDSDSSCAIVESGTTKIVIPANSNTAFINGTESTLDVPAKIVNDRIMVPLRFISESIDKTVIWDDLNKTVLIY